jgi:hypothetical protein
MKRLLMVCLSTLAFLSPAAADDIPGITDEDNARLSLFEDTRSKALKTAQGGDAVDVAQLDKAYAGTPLVLNPKTLVGNWSCQTFKLGGGLALVAYTPFKCRITLEKGQLLFRKLSGSQRTSGKLYVRSDTQLVYLGAGTYNDDPVKPYGLGPDTDEMAVVESYGKNQLLFQFPVPDKESDFDVMLLKKTSK